MLRLLHLTCFLMPAFTGAADHDHVYVHVYVQKRRATHPTCSLHWDLLEQQHLRCMRRTLQNVDVNVVVVV